MKLLLILVCLAPAFCQELPNHKLTPGSVRTTDKKEICGTLTGTVRKVKAADHRQAFINYGIDCAKVKCGQLYEVDHLISLEIGGGNELTNLWPQPYTAPGAHQKDILENKLHKMICNGEISPVDAQKKISTDWWMAYKEYVKPGDANLGR